MHLIRIATLLLCCAPLLACSSSGPDTGAAGEADAAPGFIARQVDTALELARQKVRKGNLDLARSVNVGQRAAKGRAKGEISPQGDLLIGGKPVAIDADQRQALLAYREQLLEIVDAALVVGSRGAGIADEAVKGVWDLVFGGEEAEAAFEARIEAATERLEADVEAMICARLPALMASQQELASRIPEFGPYADLSQQDIDECGDSGSKRDVPGAAQSGAPSPRG